MACLIFIRHGETDWNTEGRWQGQADIPLNSKGTRQAVELSRALAEKGIQYITSSDLTRALDTARPLASILKLPIVLEPRLREIHQGEWQGMLVSEIQLQYASLFTQRSLNPEDTAPPGGESMRQVRERSMQVVNELANKFQNETIAIFSHGFTLAVIRTTLENRPSHHVWDLVPNAGSWWETNI